MHVGLSMFFQGAHTQLDDHAIVRNQLEFADEAEARGFQSLWTAEHHFTRYHMMPNPLQLLSYLAGRTKTVQLGTMVVVLPWHDPIRVAEEAAWLDTVSGGRLVLGFGRGLGPVEFDAFRLEMGESRQRFTEYATAITEGLESGVMRSDGELYKQPDAELHPPPVRSFRGRTYVSAVSPESAPIAAKLGYGLLLIAQKPWKTTIDETNSYRDMFVDINGYEPPAPILVNFTTVDESPARAKELHEEYTVGYARSTVEHYDFTNPRLEHVNGYEYYAGLRRNINKHGLPAFNRFLADLQIGGTPDEVVEQVVDRVRMLGAGGVLNVLNPGPMPHDVARRCFDTYVDKVLPKLRAIDTHREICMPLGTV